MIQKLQLQPTYLHWLCHIAGSSWCMCRKLLKSCIFNECTTMYYIDVNHGFCHIFEPLNTCVVASHICFYEFIFFFAATKKTHSMKKSEFCWWVGKSKTSQFIIKCPTSHRSHNQVVIRQQCKSDHLPNYEWFLVNFAFDLQHLTNNGMTQGRYLSFLTAVPSSEE